MANERLYQFPSKASPVPADIIFAGDSADAFDEVNITIAALIGAYPNLIGIGGLTLSANTYAYVNNASAFVAGTITTLGVSLIAGANIAVMQATLGYTATPTASIFAGWDANSNLSANNFNTGYATTVTAAGTTTLTVASAQQQYFTGSSNQTVAMPITSTLVLGQSWLFVNLSSGTITINSSGGNAITTLGANSSTRVTCILTSGTSAASWSAATPVAGSGVVNSGTINNLTYYAATGSTVSALATAANGVLVTSAGGVPSISSTLPSGIAATSMVLTTPSLGVATATSITFSPTTGGIVGTPTNNNASAGFVGEYISSTVLAGSAVNATSGNPVDVTSISLTAGDWDVEGVVDFLPAAGTIPTQLITWISTTSATLPTRPNNGALQQLASSGLAASTTQALLTGKLRLSLSGTTTVYLSTTTVFSVSTMGVYGFIGARRVR